MLNEPSPVSERLNLWDEQITIARKHIQMGQVLQGQGVAFIKGDPTNGAMPDPERGGALVANGIKIERDAWNWLQQLLDNKPRGK